MTPYLSDFFDTLEPASGNAGGWFFPVFPPILPSLWVISGNITKYFPLPLTKSNIYDKFDSNSRIRFTWGKKNEKR